MALGYPRLSRRSANSDSSGARLASAMVQNAAVFGGGALGLNPLISRCRRQPAFGVIGPNLVPVVALKSLVFFGSVGPGNEVAPVVCGEIYSVGFMICGDDEPAAIDYGVLA